MVGSATILAVCVLAATPLKIENNTEARDYSVRLMAFQQAEPIPAESRSRRPQAPLPPGSQNAAEAKSPKAAEKEGIPGLAPLGEESTVIPDPSVPHQPAKTTDAEAGRATAESPKKDQPERTWRPAPRRQPQADPAERDIQPLQRQATPKARDVQPRHESESPISELPPAMPRRDPPGSAISTDDPRFERPSNESDGACRRNRGSGWLSGIDTEGWLDQGATLNTLSPRDRSNGPVGFNDRSNDYQLNQLYMLMKRDVNVDGDAWDIGGRVDLLYGTDSIYVESRGLETFDNFTPKWNAQRYGLAMPQCYAEFYSPWGTGLSMKVGHYYSILNYESAMATQNFFYSHSYQYVYDPHTFTGLLGATKLGDFTVQAGMTRGDDNWEDNNNDLGFVGSISWTSPNERTTIALGVDAGRNQPDPDTNVRTLYTLVLQQKLAQRWQYVIEGDWAFDPRNVEGVAGTEHDSAAWYGISNYLFYTVNERWKAGMRFEWFHDQDGYRIPDAGRTGNYYELTAGVNWTPNKFVTVRPEVRWDWSGTPDLLPFGDNTRSNQLLLSCDAILRF